LALEVTLVLDEVPPYLVADQLVAEARRVAGLAVALYVVDVDGSHLLRLAGSPEFPQRIEAPPALGPEIVPEELPAFYTRLQERPPWVCEDQGALPEVVDEQSWEDDEEPRASDRRPVEVTEIGVERLGAGTTRTTALRERKPTPWCVAKNEIP
jgi:hypothetical protein